MTDALYPREFKTVDGRVLVIDRARLEDLEEIYDFIQQHFIAKNPNLYLIPYIEERSESFRPFLTGYITLRKVAGWSGKVELAEFGQYDDPTVVGS